MQFTIDISSIYIGLEDTYISHLVYVKDKRKARGKIETAHILIKSKSTDSPENQEIAAKKALRKLERKRDDALSEYHQAKKTIEQEEDALLDEVSEKLELTKSVETLFSIRWTLTQ